MNKDYSEAGMKLGLGTGTKKQARTPGQIQAGSDAMPMRTNPWPGLPGKSQPGNRSNGVPQAKQYPVAKGLAGGSDTEK